MNPILIVIIILTLYYLCKNNTAESFSQFAPVDWKKESAARCTALKGNAKEIQSNLQSCSATDMYGQRDSINNKIACLDAINRQIFNDRESGSWCASSVGEKTESKEVLGAQPSNIVTTTANVEKPQPKVQVESEANVLLATKSSDMVAVVSNGGVLNKSFDLIDSVGFNGYDVSKSYAAY
jgi:hypothetical protein